MAIRIMIIMFMRCDIRQFNGNITHFYSHLIETRWIQRLLFDLHIKIGI